jgi:hypothetical protein
MHLYMTLKLLAHVYYVNIVDYDTQLSWINLKVWSKKGVTMDHTNPYDLYQNHSNHPTYQTN